MWLIEGILVGSLGSVRSYGDNGCIENSVLYYGRERGGWRLPGNGSVHDFRQSRQERSKGVTSE